MLYTCISFYAHFLFIGLKQIGILKSLQPLKMFSGTSKSQWFFVSRLRLFLDGMNIGPQTLSMTETWLSFKVKRRSFFQKQRKAATLTKCTPTSPSHQHRQTALSWHFEIGWGGMAMANRNGLARPTSRSCHQQFFQNARYNNNLINFFLLNPPHCPQTKNATQFFSVNYVLCP